jgi:hypothetical protein
MRFLSRGALPVLALLGGALLLALGTGCGGDDAPAESAYTVVSPPSLKPGDAVPRAKGEVVLEIAGAVARPMRVDVGTLDRFGQIAYDVKDPFTKRVEHYSGVLASSALAMAGADPKATRARAHALDEYSVDVKVSDLERYPAMIVTRMNGKRMAVADGGPLKLIFPYHAYDLDHDVYDHQWVWSLDSLTLR